MSHPAFRNRRSYGPELVDKILHHAVPGHFLSGVQASWLFDAFTWVDTHDVLGVPDLRVLGNLIDECQAFQYWHSLERGERAYSEKDTYFLRLLLSDSWPAPVRVEPPRRSPKLELEIT